MHMVDSSYVGRMSLTQLVLALWYDLRIRIFSLHFSTTTQLADIHMVWSYTSFNQQIADCKLHSSIIVKTQLTMYVIM
jgi:hypothetical protein